MVAEGGVGVLPALSKGENCQGNINMFGVFWLQCCQDKVLFQLQDLSPLVLPELLLTPGLCGPAPRSLQLQSPALAVSPHQCRGN